MQNKAKYFREKRNMFSFRAKGSDKSTFIPKLSAWVHVASRPCSIQWEKCKGCSYWFVFYIRDTYIRENCRQLYFLEDTWYMIFSQCIGIFWPLLTSSAHIHIHRFICSSVWHLNKLPFAHYPGSKRRTYVSLSSAFTKVKNVTNSERRGYVKLTTVAVVWSGVNSYVHTYIHIYTHMCFFPFYYDFTGDTKNVS